jgi:uncharacterized protein YhaN
MSEPTDALRAQLDKDIIIVGDYYDEMRPRTREACIRISQTVVRLADAFEARLATLLPWKEVSEQLGARLAALTKTASDFEANLQDSELQCEALRQQKAQLEARVQVLEMTIDYLNEGD